MNDELYTVVFGVLAIICILLSMQIVGWKNFPHGSIKIKFKDFESFYCINPKRWKLHSAYIRFELPSGMHNDFCFNFIDYIRYVLWNKNRKKIKKECDNAKIISQMLGIVKQDIKKMEEAAAQQQNDGIEQMRNVINNLRFNNTNLME